MQDEPFVDGLSDSRSAQGGRGGGNRAISPPSERRPSIDFPEPEPEAQAGKTPVDR